MKIHHIGYLVKDINKSVEKFKKLGYSIKKDVYTDDFRQIQVSLLEKDGYAIELISACSQNSTVFNLQKKLGNTPYHICYTSNEFEKDLEKLYSAGYVKMREIESAPDFGFSKLIFLYDINLGIIELAEEKE